jgi:hypothetical protein
MPSLPELQRQFAATVFAEPGTAPTFVLAGDANAAERMDIYRNAVFANYRSALRQSYPVVLRLVGGPFFDAAVDAFVRAHPSTSGDLGDYGDAFGDFLAGYPHAAALPYLPDVARLEWAIDEAKRAADASASAAAVLAALGRVAGERLPAARLVLAPSCRLVASAFPILRIWRAHQDDDVEPVSLDAGAEHVLVRRVGDQVAIATIAPAEHAFLVALAHGSGIGAAIDAARAFDAAFDLGAALRAHLASGVIAGVSAD